jgi:PHD/YefM family antitoxin component YafN of YafNO toxin-antitoxin module
MKKVSIRQLIEHPDKIAQKLCNDSKDGMLLISGNKKFVVLSESKYNSISQTLHLISTKANVKTIAKGIDQVKEGGK